MDRTVLHCDCNGYFASVECIQRPELWHVPMAVCGDPESRHGIILAKNELAKKYGIVTAETVWAAKRKCPELVLVVPRHHLYHEYSQRVNAIYGQYTDQVEPFGVDESWLDVTNSQRLFGDGKKIADTLRERIRSELGLTISVGVSFNKVFAKLGSDYKKPDATTVITRENFQELLYPLPVSALLFVGKTTAAHLEKFYIRTIGDLAKCPLKRLESILGKSGSVLWEYANGLDDSPVGYQDAEGEAAKSVGNGMTFRRNLVGMEDIRPGLIMLVDSVAARLRANGQKCQTLAVQIKDPALKVISRQKVLPYATNITRELYTAALEIMADSWNMKAPIRMITVTASHLTDKESNRQLDFFSQSGDEYIRQQRLDAAVDRIRRRFGEDALGYASLMATDIVHKKEESGKAKIEDESPENEKPNTDF